MRKALAATAILIGLAVPLVASAAPVKTKAATAAAAPYKLPASYQAVYCYPTGSYWTGQRASYPEYYAANDAYYRSQYGAGTMYCPN